MRYNEAFVSVSLNYPAIELREILLFVVVVYFMKAAHVFGFCPKLAPLYLEMEAMKFSNRKSIVFLLMEVASSFRQSNQKPVITLRGN